MSVQNAGGQDDERDLGLVLEVLLLGMSGPVLVLGMTVPGLLGMNVRRALVVEGQRGGAQVVAEARRGELLLLHQ